MNRTVWFAVALVFVAASGAAAACGEDAPRPRVGLALSGGGARGLAHVGVLRAFEEAGIPIDCIAGTSMGAIVGSLRAAGLSAAQIEAVVYAADWQAIQGARSSERQEPQAFGSAHRSPIVGLGLDGWRLRLPAGAFADYRVNRFLIRHLAVPGWRAAGDFDRLPVPFRAVTYDLRSGQPIVIGEGDLARAVRASASVPVVLAPVAIGNSVLVDGGIADNVPADVPRGMGADIVVSVDVTSPATDAFDDSLGVANRLMDLLSSARNRLGAGAPADLTVRPDLTGLRFGDFDEKERIVARGLEAGRRAAEELQVLLAGRLSSPPPPPPTPPARVPGRVAGVRMLGLERINEKLVRSAFDVASGSRFDLDRMLAGLDAVHSLGLFDSCWLRLVPTQQGDVEAWLRLTEAAPMHLELGVSYDEADRAAGFVGWHRVDLLGGLAQARLVAHASEAEAGFDAGVDIQRLGASPVGFALLARRVEQRPRVFRDQHYVARAKFVRRDARFDLRVRLPGGGLGSAGFVVGEVRTAARLGLEFPPATDSVRVAHANAIWDSLDDHASPTTGSAVGASVERALPGLGDDRRFSLLRASLRRVWSIGPRSRFEVRARVGLSWGMLPVYEQFRLGGPSHLPGYDREELWGAQALAAGLDYSVPLAGSLRGHVGAGAGNVWGSRAAIRVADLRFGVGLGLEHPTPIGPARVEWGLSDGGRTELYFSIGHRPQP